MKRFLGGIGWASLRSVLRIGWRALRPYSFTATIVPVVCGSLAVRSVGGSPIRPGAALLMLLSALLLHAGANLLNDYYDDRLGFDTPSAPGSGKRSAEKRISPDTLRRRGHHCLAAGAATGLVLALWREPWLLPPGACGVLGAYSYSHPHGGKYRGLGEPMVFLLMGPILFGSAFLAAGGGFDMRALWLSLPFGCLVTAIMLVNNLRDLEMDRKGGFRTLPARIGPRAAKGMYLLLLTAGPVLPPLYAALGWMPRPAWIVLAAAIPAIPLGRRVYRAAAPYKSLARAPEQTAALYLLFGILMILGLTLGGVAAPPSP